jgi:hypothetical protein
MPTWLALILTILLGGLTYLEARTVYRSTTSGVPYLFFHPHPSYRNRPANKRSGFLWFSVFGHAWGVMVFGLSTIVCAAFLLGLG